MVDRLKDNLKEYIANGRLVPICQDIFDYIKEIDDSFFDGVTSSWAIHNFVKDKRKYLLKEIFRTLKQNKYAVSEVAYIIKYANPSSFVSSFKKKYKCSPLAYVRTKALESNPI